MYSLFLWRVISESFLFSAHKCCFLMDWKPKCKEKLMVSKIFISLYGWGLFPFFFTFKPFPIILLDLTHFTTVYIVEMYITLYLDIV